MNLSVVGISHKTAPIEVREEFFLRTTEQNLFLSELRADPSVLEAFVVSTCNRTEVYLNLLEKSDPTVFIIKHLVAIKKLSFKDSYVRYFYCYENEAVVKHLMRVATGLDSLVLGEKQILGQIKFAAERAIEKTMFLKNFHVLSNLAIRAGKKAQTETHISYGGSSVSWAAIAMTEKELGTLKDKSILIMGAGKMGEIALNQIKSKGIKKIYLMNRTESIAREMADKFGGEAASFCDMKEILNEVDVCICSTGAPHYILEKPTVEKVMNKARHKKLLFVDISMPRNIDPLVGDLDSVKLFTIDDLDAVVQKNMEKRKAAVVKVEKIVERKQVEFYQKLDKAIARRDESITV